MLVLENKYTIRNYTDNMSDEEFYEFCLLNKDLRIERDKNRNTLVMSPVNNKSGYYERQIIIEIALWERKHQKGISFSSSTGFTLPNGATRSPDACWISSERWATVEDEDKERFASIVPDFIVEIRSKTDRLKTLQDKMEEWQENGVRLGWLIDPKTEQTYIYRVGTTPTITEGFDKVLDGEEIMPGFEFDLQLLQLPE